MDKQDNLKLFALVLGLIMIIGIPIYTIINNKYLDKSGIEIKGVILKKDKILAGKPLSNHYYFTIRYNVNNKSKIKEIGIPEKAFYIYKVNDTISILLDKVNEENIKWPIEQD
ncbi:hypothetical protein ABW636_07470 [Aquimarina sp. 2201CG1-2-11]|uniref:hypothetical protein n=1 Tax=Aquimarina discodermiae TaxID=3231043 RepID=UPI003462F308